LGEEDIVGHTVAVTVLGDAVASGEGWSVFVDDVMVGEGC
jgi:predicted RNA-binding protein with TRAM domain